MLLLDAPVINLNLKVVLQQTFVIYDNLAWAFLQLKGRPTSSRRRALCALKRRQTVRRLADLILEDIPIVATSC